MGKLECAKIPKAERQELERELLETLTKFGLTAQGKEFVHDLLMDSEVVMLARRLRIARRLLQGHSYRRIARDLRVGIDTIEKIHEWLDAKCEDYRRVLPPLLKKGPKKLHKIRVPIEPFSFRELRKRYPAHMLLFNLLLGDPRSAWAEEDGE